MAEIYSDITKDLAFTYPINYILSYENEEAGNNYYYHPIVKKEFPAEAAMNYLNIKKIEEVKYNQVLTSLNNFYDTQYNKFSEILNKCTYANKDNEGLSTFKLAKDILAQLSELTSEFEYNRIMRVPGDVKTIRSEKALNKYPSRELLLKKYKDIQGYLNRKQEQKRDAFKKQLGINVKAFASQEIIKEILLSKNQTKRK